MAQVRHSRSRSSRWVARCQIDEPIATRWCRCPRPRIQDHRCRHVLGGELSCRHLDVEQESREVRLEDSSDGPRSGAEVGVDGRKVDANLGLEIDQVEHQRARSRGTDPRPRAGNRAFVDHPGRDELGVLVTRRPIVSRRPGRRGAFDTGRGSGAREALTGPARRLAQEAPRHGV